MSVEKIDEHFLQEIKFRFEADPTYCEHPSKGCGMIPGEAKQPREKVRRTIGMARESQRSSARIAAASITIGA